MPTAFVLDIIELYQKTFGRKPYVVPGISDTGNENNDYRLTESASDAEKEFTAKGSLLKEQYNGVEIMLPVRLYDGPTMIAYMPFVVVKISGSKTIIETPLSERQGSVKEQFNIDDYKIDLKGFLIGADRKFPESEVDILRKLHETKKAVTIDNAITNIFLTNPTLPPDEQRRVVVYGFDMPDVSAGRDHVRPFSLSLKSDTVFTLELEA